MKLVGMVMGALLCTSLVYAEDSRTGIYFGGEYGFENGPVSAHGENDDRSGRALANAATAKLGYSFISNLAVHGTASIAASLAGPVDDGWGMVLLGGGATCWLPFNIPVSASAGTVNFLDSDGKEYSDDWGFGFRVSVGKEFRFARRGGLGVNLYYQHAEVNDGDSWKENVIGLTFFIGRH